MKRIQREQPKILIPSLILDFFKKILSDKLVKVFSLSTVSTLFRMISSLIVNKLIASFIGSTGFVFIGQIGNLIAMSSTFASGIGIGVTKYSSQFTKSEINLKNYINTAFTIILIYSLIVTLLFFVFSDFLSKILFKNDTYQYVFIILSFLFVGTALNILYISILNGFQEYKKFVIVNILNSILYLVYVSLSMYFWRLLGVLLAFATYNSLNFFVTYFFTRKIEIVKFSHIKIKIEKEALFNLLKFSIMPIASGLAYPLVQIFARNFIISEINLDSAGLWEGINRISNLLNTVITTSLGVYYLPRLSELKTDSLVLKEIRNTLIKIIPSLAFLTMIIIFFKKQIILLLFTQDFIPMKDLFFYQFVGNIFKISGWIIAYKMLAKAMVREYLITESLYYAVYICSMIALVPSMGLEGAVLGYAISYLVYFIYLTIRFQLCRNNSLGVQDL
ncbi:MAG: O-antigen translocase [Deferribacteres bacterium]|nr:O-antigen translocase [Deferribacteres bacterium]